MRFAFNPGGQITFGASIRNPGPSPVTVTGIAVDDGPPDRHMFKVARLMSNPVVDESTAVFQPATAALFGPTRVGAGMELPVFLTITIPDVAQASGGGLYFDDLAVDYDVLGLPRHQRVPMGFRLFVHSARLVARRYHHANHTTMIVGDLLPVRLPNSRTSGVR
ncbi:hypothetical protein ACFFWC_10585 [Plantactinospora siamensis]|uniref:Uncharacterized protein n=1 Tax=Plantactinospora siamensis TaxID=555372 RepID=A0ABV6NUS0_9ACTN